MSKVSYYPISHNLCNTFQSAYHPCNRTEAVETLKQVVNDLFLSLIKGNMSMLALLDFCSAHTIDHSIIVHHLHADFGYADTVLQWFSSYPTDDAQFISI